MFFSFRVLLAFFLLVFFLLAYKEKNTTTNKLGGLVATFSIIRELSLRVGSGSAELACPYLGGSSCDLEERDRT